MKFTSLLLAGTAAVAFGMTGGAQKAAAATCPAFGADADCGFIITLNPDGSASVASTGQGPYDSSDDTLVGVVNNSGHSVGFVTLSSSANIFGFEGDGIDTYGGGLGPSGTSLNSQDTTGYGGPISFFTNITGGSCASSSCMFLTSPATGNVNFIGGLADGATTYFSLEEDLSEAGFTAPSVGGVPEPASLALIGGGLAGLGLLRRRKKA